MGRIDAAAKHKILPDQQAKFVAGSIKHIVFVDAAAPNPQHVHVAFPSHAQAFTVTFWRDTRQKVVVGNPVRAAGKNGNVVDLEHK